MRNRIARFSYKWLIFGIPALIALSLFAVSRSILFAKNPDTLAIAITLDFLITIPVIYFLLIYRRQQIPKITVLSVFVVCLVLASFILPPQQQSLLKSIRVIAVPIIEVLILGFVLLKVRQIIRSYRNETNTQLDFFDILTKACTNVFPGVVGRLLATEIAVPYYLFKTNSKNCPSESEFTYFKKSGIKLTVSVFIGLIVIETIVVHVLLMDHYPTLAWVLSGIGIYTCFQVMALLKSMNHRLIFIDSKSRVLYLRYGFFSQTEIPLSQIISIEKNKKSLPTDKSVVQFSPLGNLDSHNLIIRLKDELLLQRIYGIKKRYRNLAIYIDDRDTFVSQIESISSIH